MSVTQGIIAIQADPQGAALTRPAAEPATPKAGSGADSASINPDLRLVIEEDKTSGSYVYKTVDSRTGQVVAQIPREEVLRLREAPAYEPGAVVNART